MTSVSIDEIETRESRLFEAFDDEFRDSLEPPRKEIEDKLKEWANSIKKFDPRIDNVFDIQSRIKGIDTFREKIRRKNYIFDWDVYEEKEENQNVICEKLPDLIGIRINCYFANHEPKIYSALKDALKKHEIEGVDEFKDEYNKQRNGKEIFKISARFKEKYHFEVQVKSIVHNVWGEVEHKTVYKNPCYDGYIHKKKELTEALHEVLFASDNQLLSIFQMEESEETLIQALFYWYTKKEIETECKTSILANHYDNYFKSFEKIKIIEIIKDFVSKRMVGQQFERHSIETKETSDTIKRIIDHVQSLFPRFYIYCLYKIDNILNVHESYNSFLVYFIQSVVTVDENEDDEYDSFGEDDDDIEGNKQTESENIKYKDYIMCINDKLGECIKQEKIEEHFKV